MTMYFKPAKPDSEFIAQIEKLSGQDLLACYQCGKCSAGCPMAPYMNILPNQLIRLAQLGMSDQVLNSSTIWACVSCLTCNTRCPKGIDIAEIIEAARQIQLRKRKDHLVVEDLPAGALRELPPIALIGAMRKFTS